MSFIQLIAYATKDVYITRPPELIVREIIGDELPVDVIEHWMPALLLLKQYMCLFSKKDRQKRSELRDLRVKVGETLAGLGLPRAKCEKLISCVTQSKSRNALPILYFKQIVRENKDELIDECHVYTHSRKRAARIIEEAMYDWWWRPGGPVSLRGLQSIIQLNHLNS
jgi:hypothetical protein